MVNSVSLSFDKFFTSYLYVGETEKLNMFQSITNAMDIILEKDPTAGEAAST